MNAALGLVLVVLAADADPLKGARTAFGEGDADACLAVVEKVLSASPAPPAALAGRAQMLRAQCLNLKDGPNRATIALQAALEIDPEIAIDASRTDPQLVGIFEGLRQRLKAEVQVTADKPDTVVIVDGAEVGPAPAALKLVAGRHRIIARTRDGRFQKEKELVLGPKRTYDLMFELTAVTGGAPVAAVPTVGADGPARLSDTGFFFDGRALFDPGKGVGFDVGAGFGLRHFAGSLHLVRGGYLGAALRLAGRLPLASDRFVLGLGVQVPVFFVPAQGSFAGGQAVGVGGNLTAALHSGIFEPFVEVGAVSMVAVPAAATTVPKLSPVLGGGVRVFLP